jgi:hypothetical protein
MAVDAHDAKKSEFSAELNHFIESLCKTNLLREGGSENAEPLKTITLPDSYSFEFESYTDMQELLSLDPIHDVDDAIGWPKQKEDA